MSSYPLVFNRANGELISGVSRYSLRYVSGYPVGVIHEIENKKLWLIVKT